MKHDVITAASLGAVGALGWAVGDISRTGSVSIAGTVAFGVFWVLAIFAYRRLIMRRGSRA